MRGPPHAVWLSTDQIARLYGVSSRVARKALARCLAGGSWRGQQLTVSATPGRGGRAGLSYRVRLDCLPPELQERALELFPELATAVAAPAPVEATAGDAVPVAAGEVLPPERPRQRWPRKGRAVPPRSSLSRHVRRRRLALGYRPGGARRAPQRESE